VFTIININHFQELSLAAFFRILLLSLRFDISGVCAVNGLYILLMLLPIPIWRTLRWERFTQWLFIITNTIALLFEIGDWAYFPFNFKRSTADVLDMISRKGDFWSLLPHLVVDFWYVPLAMVIMTIVLYRTNKKICTHTPLHHAPQNMRPLRTGIWQTGRLLVVAAITIIGIRGGLQYVPIGIRNAVLVADSRFTPIVLNTPFSIINTFVNDGLEDVHYYKGADLLQYINPKKQYDGKPFQPKNVVFIVLESFSKEFTKLGGRLSYTPFLDSLMSQSLVCTNAYANAVRSAEGIPAIVAGLPSMMDEAIYTSKYGTNRMNAMPNLLKEKGYTSAFYHGGTNGTMSFDVFCAAAGYDNYYGRNEYNNEADYDGNWGIWDEPFFQYFSQGISKMKQPFFATLFSLSSHPPYKLPPQYAHTFAKGTHPVHPCIMYSDMALRKFFETAKTQAWYNNTLFVITADHCAPKSNGKVYNKNMRMYAIPILLYAPNDSTLHGRYDSISQQIDILPTVLDYLGYNKSFFAMGSSILRQGQPRYTINQVTGVYQLLMNGYLMKTTQVKPISVFAYPQDSLCRHNLLKEQPEIAQNQLLPYLKAIMQTYHTAAIHDKMYILQTDTVPSVHK
jgi:hypothetical protein